MSNLSVKGAVNPKKSCKAGNSGEKKVIMLNITQFELTKILYSSGILAECSLTPSAKLFLWALCSHYNPNNETMFPSQQTVASKLGISEKSAQRAVKELKTLGLIDYETKRVNHYTFGEKFFELVKMSGAIGQNVLREGGQNVRLTNKNEKRKEHADFSFKNERKSGENVDYRRQAGYKTPQSKDLPNRRTPNSAETKKMIEEREKIRKMGFNPSEFNRKEALDWVKSLPKFWLLKSKLAEFLVEKYKFSEFQYILKNSKSVPVSDFNSNFKTDLNLQSIDKQNFCE